MTVQTGGSLRKALLVAAAACVLAATSISAPGGGPARAADERPNVVLIVTDDQRLEMLSAMPNVRRMLVDKGVTFENAFAVNPLCCPSRATILTGRYSHSTGVYTNGPPLGTKEDGGFWAFEDESTVATWLDDAGYRTALVGKYLNGYRRDVATYVPPGWDHWVGQFDRPATRAIDGSYYTYSLSVNGEVKDFGTDPSDYGTDVLGRHAARFIRSTGAPLFLYFTPFAPHTPAIPAPRHRDAFGDLPRSRPTSFNELDVSDKPAWVRRLSPLTRDERRAIDVQRLRMYRTLLAVDDAVARIVRALRDTERLHDTLIVFMSDNGYMLGEHRRTKKRDPYEESIRVPLVMRYDDATDGAMTDEHLVGNVDIAPTIADVTGVPTPGFEGASVAPFLYSAPVQWREELLLEHKHEAVVPTYCGIRSERYAYVAYETGDVDDEELYDLELDPFQLDNRAGDPAQAERVAHFRARVRLLCDPAPEGWDFNPAPPAGR